MLTMLFILACGQPDSTETVKPEDVRSELVVKNDKLYVKTGDEELELLTTVLPTRPRNGKKFRVPCNKARELTLKYLPTEDLKIVEFDDGSEGFDWILHDPKRYVSVVTDSRCEGCLNACRLELSTWCDPLLDECQ